METIDIEVGKIYRVELLGVETQHINRFLVMEIIEAYVLGQATYKGYLSKKVSFSRDFAKFYEI